MDVRFRRSITETLEILKHMNKLYTEKLPNKFIKFLQDNQDTSYIPKFDYTKELQGYDVNKETKALLGIMYLKYWSSDSQRKEYLKILDDNQKKYEETINEKYDVDNLFKKEKNEYRSENTKNEINENMQIIEYKESVIQKIVNKIKKLLKNN